MASAALMTLAALLLPSQKPTISVTATCSSTTGAIENSLFTRGLAVVPDAPQVFLRRQSGMLRMLIAEVVDDSLVCGPRYVIQALYKDVSRICMLNSLRKISIVRLSGMDIAKRNDGSTTVDVSHYIAAYSSIPLSAQRRKQQEDEFILDEHVAFWTLCGKLSYLGATGMPKASFPASHIQQRLAYPVVSD
jgi:hypothetical protein